MHFPIACSYSMSCELEMGILVPVSSATAQKQCFGIFGPPYELGGPSY